MSDPNTLRIRWSKREKALLYEGPTPTGGMLAYHLESEIRLFSGASEQRTLTKELEARGYDLTTLRFSIRKKDSNA